MSSRLKAQPHEKAVSKQLLQRTSFRLADAPHRPLGRSLRFGTPARHVTARIEPLRGISCSNSKCSGDAPRRDGRCDGPVSARNTPQVRERQVAAPDTLAAARNRRRHQEIRSQTGNPKRRASLRPNPSRDANHRASLHPSPSRDANHRASLHPRPNRHASRRARRHGPSRGRTPLRETPPAKQSEPSACPQPPAPVNAATVRLLPPRTRQTKCLFRTSQCSAKETLKLKGSLVRESRSRPRLLRHALSLRSIEAR